MCTTQKKDRLNNGPDKIQAVFFDYGGTLDAPGIAWRDHFYPLYTEAGINVSPEAFATAFYAADDSLVAQNPTHMNLSQIVSEQVKRVLEHLHAFDKSVHQKITSRFLAETFTYIKQIRPVLEKVKGSFRTGIISNNYGNLENICKETGLDTFMDVLIDSNLIGYTKPAKQIFMAALSAVGMEPASSVMVGDSLPRDIMGAKDLGMIAVWLAPEERAQALEQADRDIDIILGLHELPGILGI